MDELDYRILGILKKNARENFVDIAKALGVTEGTVRNRVKNLIEAGAIKRFTVEYEPPIEALVILKSSMKNNRELIRSLKTFSDNIFEISGEHDIALIVEAQSVVELNKKVDRIRELKGVAGTNTAIRLN